MDERSVQQAGGSTYRVSLPAAWVDANGIDSDSTLRVVTRGDRIVMSASDGAVVRHELDVGSLDPDEIRDALLGLYENGVDEIVFTADPITLEQRRAAQETTKTLLGAELLEATGTRVVVKSVIEPGSITIESGLDRIESLSLNMFSEGLQALVTGDEDLARSVVERDEEVDRLWSFVSRRLRSTIDATAIEEEGPSDPRRGLDYYEAARQLERIADAATDIARNVADPYPDDVTATVEALGEGVTAATETVVGAITADSPDRARERLREYRLHARSVDRLIRDVDEAVGESDAPSTTSLLVTVRQCVGYTRNLAAIARCSAYARP